MLSVFGAAALYAFIMTASKPMSKNFLKTNSVLCTKDLEFVHWLREILITQSYYSNHEFLPPMHCMLFALLSQMCLDAKVEWTVWVHAYTWNSDNEKV